MTSALDGEVEPEPHLFTGPVVFGPPGGGEGVHQRETAAVLPQIIDLPGLPAAGGLVGRRQPVGAGSGRHATQCRGMAVADCDGESGGVVPEVDRRVGAGVHDDVGHQFGHEQQNGVDEVRVDTAVQRVHYEPPGRPWRVGDRWKCEGAAEPLISGHGRHAGQCLLCCPALGDWLCPGPHDVGTCRSVNRVPGMRMGIRRYPPSGLWRILAASSTGYPMNGCRTVPVVDQT